MDELLFKIQMFVAGQLGVAVGELENATSDFSRQMIQRRVDETRELLEEVTNAISELNEAQQ